MKAVESKSTCAAYYNLWNLIFNIFRYSTTLDVIARFHLLSRIYLQSLTKNCETTTRPSIIKIITKIFNLITWVWGGRFSTVISRAIAEAVRQKIDAILEATVAVPTITTATYSATGERGKRRAGALTFLARHESEVRSRAFQI